jgi:hypothetical protein
MTIQRGYVSDSTGAIIHAWDWHGDPESCPYPDNLVLAEGDTVAEEPAETGCAEWDAFQHNLGAWHVLDGARTPKEALSFSLDTDTVPADGESVATVSGLPVGIRATLGIWSAQVDDGELELTFDLPGTYTFSLSHPQYLPGEVTIYAT